MADIYYPATLPEIIAPGYKSQDQDGVIRTDMDAGPQKTRPRYTACSEYITCQVVCDDTEHDNFMAFYRITTARGALRFVMKHPGTGVNRYFRFREPPAAAETSGLWAISLQLEALP